MSPIVIFNVTFRAVPQLSLPRSSFTRDVERLSCQVALDFSDISCSCHCGAGQVGDIRAAVHCKKQWQTWMILFKGWFHYSHIQPTLVLDDEVHLG